MTSTRLATGVTDANGNLTLTSSQAVSGSTDIIARSTSESSGEELETITVNPVSLSRVGLSAEDIVFKGDSALIMAQIFADISDLSGYTLEFSGAVTGKYLTDRYGQVKVYYNAMGTGNKTVTVTAGNWSASKTFKDLITYWNAIENKYQEKYTYSQGFTKLAQYYQLQATNVAAYLCIGDYANIGDWELNFRIVNSVSNVYFDIFSWTGNPVVFSNFNGDKLLSFNANDLIKAVCINGNLTVTRNGNPLFTKYLTADQYPGLFAGTGIPTGGDVSNPNPSVTKTLTFDELELMER